jgi:hypothetical protein
VARYLAQYAAVSVTDVVETKETTDKASRPKILQYQQYQLTCMATSQLKGK